MQAILEKTESYFAERTIMAKDDNENIKIPRWAITTFLVPTVIIVGTLFVNVYMTGDLVKSMQEVRLAMMQFTAEFANHDARIANLERRAYGP